MGDLFVHTRMKACCREALGRIDQEKARTTSRAGIFGVPSLREELGEKTITQARAAIPGGGGASEATGDDAEMEQLTRRICAQICQNHATEHEGSSETREAAFWRDLEAAFKGTFVQQQRAARDSGGDPAKLSSTAADARAKYPKACNQSTAAVASAYGHPELEGRLANDQVSYMQENWTAVDAQQAQERANRGELVVAGLAGSGHGHTAVVVPGQGAIKPDGNFYPNVSGGAMNPAGFSDGTKTAGDVWSRSNRGNVEYFVP